jgi:tRNA A37 threonylcarbamoyladenosine dehydratase
VQAKSIGNIFNKIKAENFTDLKKETPIQVQEASKTPNRHDPKRTSPQHIVAKTISTKNKERILKAVREKNQITYKDKPFKIIADFSTETLKPRKAWCEIFQLLKENNFSSRKLDNKL